MSSNHQCSEWHEKCSWRAHHGARKRSDLDQRKYCEFHDFPQKAFENWRQKFGPGSSATQIALST